MSKKINQQNIIHFLVRLGQQPEVNKSVTYKRPLSRKVLKEMGFSRQDVEQILWVAEQNGGISDFEILEVASDNIIFSCER